MATRTAVPITVEQYEQFAGPPGLRDELIYGEIVMSPQPKPRQQQIVKNLVRLLDEALAGDSRYVAQQNTNIKIRGVHSMPAPDVFVANRKIWLDACESNEYLSHPPVLVIEVISPANRKRRVEQKTQLYLDIGVVQVWLVHPRDRAIRIYDPLCLGGQEAGSEIQLPEPLKGRIDRDSIFWLK